MNSDKRIIGIDLGTTTTCVCYINQNNKIGGKNPEIILSEKNKLFSSIVTFKDDGSINVGNDDYAIEYPKSTFYSIKRFIGKKYNDETFLADKENLIYDVKRKGEDPVIPLKLKNEEKEIYPEQISALIFSTIKKRVQEATKSKLNKAVITVPANFNEAQRRATKDAAIIAGIDIVDMISEPVAASLSYAYLSSDESMDERNIMIFDFGGGTLDVAVVKINKNEYTVSATSGNSHFGGVDIDKYLYDKVTKNIKETTGIDVNDSTYPDKKTKTVLLLYCKEAKESLTTTDVFEKEINIEDKNVKLKVKRKSIEKFIEANKNKILDPIKDVLKQSNLTKDDINKVVLVGGSTRIPSVKKLIEGVINKIEVTLNPDEAVSKGAAIYGSIKMCEHNEKKIKIIDVSPMAIGIGLKDNKFSSLIPRNTIIPFKSKPKKFASKGVSENKKRKIMIPLYEGNYDECDKNHCIGEFIIEVDERYFKPDQEIIILLTIEIKSDGIELYYKVDDFRCPATRKLSKSKHSDEEIERMKEFNESLFSEPPEEKNLVNLLLDIVKIIKKNCNISKDIIEEEKKKIRKKGYNITEKEFRQQFEELESNLKKHSYKRPDSVNEILKANNLE